MAGLKAIFAKALEELEDMSGAKVGDKTMMDALIPASEAVAAYTGDSADELFDATRPPPRGGGYEAVCLQIRPGQELRDQDHRHPGRGRRVHVLVLPGAGPE